MAGDFPDIPYVQAAGDGGPRSTTQMVVIHATDNTASDEAEASYATHRPDRTSAHFYSDEDSVIQGVQLSHVAYGCYPVGNSRSVQFELSGLSNRLTDATLRRIAPIVRRVCDRYGLPIQHIGPAELRAGQRGICGHGDVTLAWGQGTHTDPGASFPWDTFISYVATPQPEEDMSQQDVDEIKARLARIEAAIPAEPNHFMALFGRVLAVLENTPAVRWGPTAPGEVNELARTLARIETAAAAPVQVQVDAATVAAALGANQSFLAALATAVNDDAAKRLAQ